MKILDVNGNDCPEAYHCDLRDREVANVVDILAKRHCRICICRWTEPHYFGQLWGIVQLVQGNTPVRPCWGSCSLSFTSIWSEYCQRSRGRLLSERVEELESELPTFVALWREQKRNSRKSSVALLTTLELLIVQTSNSQGGASAPWKAERYVGP
ncbi:hypothetical protein M514_15009 [Trichuris suis]|uniref:Uncharacterized protein n=1 Tax=Trichuris suis TaxID=68888 RepID=A0A085NT09_9BILA|nr:hypothetical protein M514_15009 [Trichuris suis]